MYAAGDCFIIGVQTRDLRDILWDCSDLWLMMSYPSYLKVWGGGGGGGGGHEAGAWWGICGLQDIA